MISRKFCLLDTGSQVSLRPKTPQQRQPHTSNKVKLVAANGTPIRSFGFVTRKIKISEKYYTFTFIVADIMRPILGIDFLRRFGMLLDLKKGQLIHSGTATPFSSTSSVVAGVNLVRDVCHGCITRNNHHKTQSTVPCEDFLAPHPHIAPAIDAREARYGAEVLPDDVCRWYLSPL